MGDLMFRENVCTDDTLSVARILRRTGFFNAEEQEIGISLVSERLQKGLSSGYLFVFAEQNDQVVAYSCHGPIPGVLDGYDLYWIAVDPSCQGSGIGSRLLAYTENRVIGLGGARLYAETSSSALYESTRLFYEHNGFALEGRLSDYYAPSDDKMLYVKRLIR